MRRPRAPSLVDGSRPRVVKPESHRGNPERSDGRAIAVVTRDELGESAATPCERRSDRLSSLGKGPHPPAPRPRRLGRPAGCLGSHPRSGFRRRVTWLGQRRHQRCTRTLGAARIGIDREGRDQRERRRHRRTGGAGHLAVRRAAGPGPNFETAGKAVPLRADRHDERAHGFIGRGHAHFSRARQDLVDERSPIGTSGGRVVDHVDRFDRTVRRRRGQRDEKSERSGRLKEGKPAWHPGKMAFLALLGSVLYTVSESSFGRRTIRER